MSQNYTPVKAGRILGIDFKNPLNLKSPYDKRIGYWFGQVAEDAKGHAVFSDHVYALRACIRNLYKKWANGKRTILAIVEDWAPRDDPQADNRPDIYAANVSGRMAGLPVNANLSLFTAGEKIDKRSQLFDFILAMADEEIYSGYSARLDDGLLVASAELYYATNIRKSIET